MIYTREKAVDPRSAADVRNDSILRAAYTGNLPALRQQHSANATVKGIFSHCPEPPYTSALFGGGAFPETAQIGEILPLFGTFQYRASALFV